MRRPEEATAQRCGHEGIGRVLHVASRMDGVTTGLHYSPGVHPIYRTYPPLPTIDCHTDWPLNWDPPQSPEDEEDIFDWSPASPFARQWPQTPSIHPNTTTKLAKDSDLFELLNRLQGARLDDQRVSMGSNSVPWTHSRHRLESLLRGSPPYPMVSLPPEGGFWCDPSDPHGHQHCLDSDGNPLYSDGHHMAPDLEESCRTYRAHFLQSEHFNFCGMDDVIGPVVLSVKYYCDSDSSTSNHIRIILRLTSGTSHRLVARQQVQPSPIALAKLVCPELSLATIQPMLCPKGSELLLNYDEHVLVNNFKFGMIYQKLGQTTEEALFGNRSHCSAMDQFLDMLGQRVVLSQHSGYRGGLDTQFGQTGQYSVYTEHQGKEVMLHVATLLPFSETDSQQLQRKRHIGNDIVSLVFQEGQTPFSPDMVTSHFLHAYIVVQPDAEHPDHYRVTVTARSDVPYFGPSLPSQSLFRKGPQFREWLLNKLINAETACYKAEKFSKLEQRTRASLLNNLVEELTTKTQDFLGNPNSENSQTTKTESGSGGIFKNVKKALASRTRSQVPPEGLNSTNKVIPKSKSSSSGLSQTEEDSGQGSQGRRSVVAPRRTTGPPGGPGKSDSGRGSLGTGSTGRCSVTSSTGRGSSPVSSTSSPDLTNRLPSHQSESDTSSLNSVECGPEQQAQVRLSPKKRASLPAFSQPNMSGHHLSLDPHCQEVVSGAVTMVTLEGNVVAGQLSKLQDEISKLKVDKLELLRQNVAAQREVKRLRERELQLQSDLTTASREINRLRVNIKQSSNMRGTNAPLPSAPLSSASIAALSLRSPPEDRDRQH